MTFKIKKGHYLEILTAQTMKYLEAPKQNNSG